jgi:hypothetical protein
MSLVKLGGLRALFALQQLALALETPTVAGDRAALLDDAMARHQDRNGIAGDRLGYLSSVARAQLGCHIAVVRLPRPRVFRATSAIHGPDTVPRKSSGTPGSKPGSSIAPVTFSTRPLNLSWPSMTSASWKRARNASSILEWSALNSRTDAATMKSPRQLIPPCEADDFAHLGSCDLVCADMIEAGNGAAIRPLSNRKQL